MANLNSPTLLIPAAIALLALGYWAGTRHAPQPAGPGSVAIQDSAKLRNETSSSFPRRDYDPRPSMNEAPRESDPAEIRRLVDDAIRKHESDFLGEALDATWASRSEAQITTALSGPKLAEFGGEAPISETATCRSKTCRVEMVFSSEEKGEGAIQAMFAQIATSLPNASSFRFPQPDGTDRILIFVTSPPPIRKPSHG